jgi:hypothetical protein
MRRIEDGCAEALTLELRGVPGSALAALVRGASDLQRRYSTTTIPDITVPWSVQW